MVDLDSDILSLPEILDPTGEEFWGPIYSKELKFIILRAKGLCLGGIDYYSVIVIFLAFVGLICDGE